MTFREWLRKINRQAVGIDEVIKVVAEKTRDAEEITNRSESTMRDTIRKMENYEPTGNYAVDRYRGIHAGHDS